MPGPGSHREWRRLPTALLCGVGLVVCSRPVAAHGSDAAYVGVTVDAWAAVVVVTVAGLSAGLLAAWRSEPQSASTRFDGASGLVGALVLVIGLAAAASVGVGRPAVGLTGLVLGGTAGVAVARRAGCAHRASVATGSVAVHRFLEGVALAAVLTAGSALAAVGAAILLVHTVTECLAVGGSSGFDSRQAVGAVAVVQVCFLLGVAGAGLGLVSTASVPDAWLLAVVGGLLAGLGVGEVGAKWAGPLPRSTA